MPVCSISHKTRSLDFTAAARGWPPQLWDGVGPIQAGNVNELNSCHAKPVGTIANYEASWHGCGIVIPLFRHPRTGGGSGGSVLFTFFLFI